MIIDGKKSSNFDQDDFNFFAINQEVVGIKNTPILLKSGRSSPYYVNWRQVTEDAYSLNQLTDYILDFVGDLGLPCDCFYGVPEGATKMALITQFKLAQQKWEGNPFHSLVLPMGRGKSKAHGDPKDRNFLGAPAGNVIVLEDVTTTGDSLIETVKVVQDIGATVIAAIGLTNRNERRDDGKSVTDAIEGLGVLYYAMSEASDLLRLVYEDDDEVSQSLIRSVEDYFEKYGTKPLIWR